MREPVDPEGGTPFQRTLLRVAILLGILFLVPLLLFVLPSLLRSGGDSAGSMVSQPGQARLGGDPILLVQDQSGDGMVDCLKKIPAVPFFKKGYSADPQARRCSGRGFQPMSDELRAMLTELLRLRTELAAQRGEILDLDHDGVADCIRFGTTRYQAAGQECPDPIEAVQPLSDSMRGLASQALALETRVRAEIDL